MKQFLLFLTVFLAYNSSAQDTSYARIYEPLIGTMDVNNKRVTDAGIVWDEGLITSGTIQGAPKMSFVARIGANGDLMWQKEFTVDSSFFDVSFNQMISTHDSSFVGVGKLRDVPNNEYRPFCMKLNSSGDTLWTRTFQLSGQSVGDYGDQTEYNGHVKETLDSSLLFGFHHSSFESSSFPDHFCLSKLSGNGDEIWSRSFVVDSSFQLTGIEQAPDSSFYAIGKSNTNAAIGVNGFLINFSSDGQLNWSKKYEGVQFHDIIVDSTSLYLGVMTNQNKSGVLKLDLTGIYVNGITYTYTGISSANSVSVDRRSNGNIVCAAVQNEMDYAPGSFIELSENLSPIRQFQVSMVMNEIISIPNKGVYAIGFGPLLGVKVGDEEMGILRLDSLMNNSSFCLEQIVQQTNALSSVLDSAFDVSPVMDSIVVYQPQVVYQDVNFVSENGCVTFLGSVKEIPGTWNETVTPNPSASEFKIDWNKYRDAELIIYNSAGTEVHRAKTKDSFISINLETEQSGLYYYRLMDDKGSQSNGKLLFLE